MDKMLNKKTVAILFGGVSTEYKISLLSSYFIINNIDRDKYIVKLIGISKEGEWFLYNGNPDYIKQDLWQDKRYIKPITISLLKNKKGFYILDGNNFSFEKIDIIFPVLHGKNGEDGSLQALFKVSGLPCVGCDYVSSAICMDKEFSHIILNYNNINTSKYIAIKKNDFDNKNFNLLENKLESSIGYPMFIKPANAGSSVGVNKAHNKDELKKYIDIAFQIDKKIVIEETIVGQEIECAVIGNDTPFASVLGEICPGAEFYNYDTKYIDDKTTLHIPARISKEISDKIREIAIKAFKVLGCSGMARIDFFLTKDNKIILNEPNTIPGFTEISMYPKLLMKSYINGIKPSQIIDQLIELALTQYNEEYKYNEIM